jgi:glycosyltransferase involved in cell wall biosynthesis
MLTNDPSKRQNSAGKVALVSPYTHLAGHYWPYTVDTATAVSNEGIEITVYASLQPRDGSLDANPLISWKSCCAWMPILRSIEKRNRYWESRSDILLRNLEFFLCLKRAQQSSTAIHIHCIEARHRILLNAVLRSVCSYSALCVGSPATEARVKLGDLYKRAFATGRLTFIVETEAVRRDWEELAGEHVVHIPAALTERTEPALSKKEARKKLGLPEVAFIALIFGTHREGKDYQTAIEAAKMSKSKPYLLFAGPLISGNDPDELLREVGYEKAISWKRYYPDDEVSLIFDACDAVVLPYAKGYTKGSGVLLQACKFGKPVIASDTGHLADFVNRHKMGELYIPGDPMSLADIYDRVAESHNDFQNAIAKAAREYSWNQLVGRYQKVFMLSSA